MKKIFLPFFIFVIIAAGVRFFQHQNKRQPSSLAPDNNGVVHFAESDLSLNENKKQIKRLILQSLDWIYLADENKFYIKHENLKLELDNVTSDLCFLYPNVSIDLEAPNVSYSGEHPEIQIQKSCASTDNISRLDFDLSFLKSIDVLRQIKTESNRLDAQIRITNWDDEVPDKWRVKRIVFFNSSKEQAQNFEITKYEILSVLGYSIEFQTTTKKQ